MLDARLMPTKTAMDFALELRGITKTFEGQTALDRLSLDVAPGEYLTILGPSGSGKSTMLRMIAGFEAVDAGEIRIGGVSMLGLPAYERGVGFVFQSFALFPHLSVFENVAFGLRNHHRAPVRDKAEVARRVVAMLALVGLQDLGARLPAQISGGQKQRVAFARSLVAEPRLVLLDEPLGALDASLRERMMVELRRIHDKLGATFLHVTGNEQEALAMGTRVAVLAHGRIAQLAAPERLIAAPASAEVARLLNCYNAIRGRVEEGCFVAGALRVGVPHGAVAGGASYCIRFDEVNVADVDAATAPGDVEVPARFLVSEYSGARMASFFDIGVGQPFEVEYHLGHRRPPVFERDRRYRLRWPAERALLFGGP